MAEAAAIARELGLSESEFAAIHQALGRDPNVTEITVFASMWSEHCSYKSTRQWLKHLPSNSPRVLAGPGAHAGVVDVGEGWAVAFKIESHNHPSAVEPYQGAATGVGGILRDIIAQGAEPTLVMDSLCFGDPKDPLTEWQRSGVVAGISGYGNAFGVANVGGRTVYHPGYQGNPLVNALAAGLVRPDAQRSAQIQGTGHAVVLVGAKTGRDGILGAAFASVELGEEDNAQRSHVQVGDPFAGRRLMRALLTLDDVAHGLVACQDLGASGISCAAFEMAAAGGVGMRLELDRVHVREAGMSGHEILVSESQERFMLVVTQGALDSALVHLRSAGVEAQVIGEVVAGDRVIATYRGEVVTDLPAELVADGAPLAGHAVAEALPEVLPATIDADAMGPVDDLLLELLASPSVADHQGPVYEQYDQSVGNRTVRRPGTAEAAVMVLPEGHAGYALCITGRGELYAADPFLGPQAALANALRRLACVGAELIAVTDGINHGPPTDPVENLRLKRSIEGLGEGLKRLEVPVTGGNCSLYNASKYGAIPPTMMVGALGVLPDVRKTAGLAFRDGQTLLLLAPWRAEPTAGHLAGLRDWPGLPVAVDLDLEMTSAEFVRSVVREGMIETATSTGTGGLGVALIKAWCGVESAGCLISPSEPQRPNSASSIRRDICSGYLLMRRQRWQSKQSKRGCRYGHSAAWAAMTSSSNPVTRCG